MRCHTRLRCSSPLLATAPKTCATLHCHLSPLPTAHSEHVAPPDYPPLHATLTLSAPCSLLRSPWPPHAPFYSFFGCLSPPMQRRHCQSLAATHCRLLGRRESADPGPIPRIAATLCDEPLRAVLRSRGRGLCTLLWQGGRRVDHLWPRPHQHYHATAGRSR